MDKSLKNKGEIIDLFCIQVSPATIDRCLKPHKITFGKGRGGTKPGSILRTEIPIRAGVWDETIPGYMEIDTVAHCGGSLMGDFVWTLTLTDINTTWTENRALWGKGASGVLDAIKDVETYLPFQLLGADCDNGSEFINHHLMRYFSSKPKTRHGYFQLTRSRPYHKGDNAHVEQKNYTHARQVLGYERLGFLDLVEPINELYRMISLLRNHFNPSVYSFTQARMPVLHKAPNYQNNKLASCVDKIYIRGGE